MPEDSQQSQVITSNKTSWKKITLTVLIIIVVSGLIVGAYWFFVLNKDSDTSDLTGPVPKPNVTTVIPSATSSTQKDEIADWESFEDQTLGISLKAPSDWLVKTSKTTSLNLSTQDPGLWNMDNYKEIRISSPDYEASGSNLEGGKNIKSGTSILIYTYRNNVKYSSSEGAVNIEMSEGDTKKEIIIDQEEAVRLDFQLNNDFYSTEIYVVHKSKAILISRTYLEGERSKYETTFNNVLSTIKFLD